MRTKLNDVYQYILEQGFDVEVRFYGQKYATAYLTKDSVRCHLARFKRHNKSIEYTSRIIRVAQKKSHAEQALLELKAWIDAGQPPSVEIRTQSRKADQLNAMLGYLQAIIHDNKKPTWQEIGLMAGLNAKQAWSQYRHLKPMIDTVIEAQQIANQ